MDELVDKIVAMKNNVIDEFNRRHPILAKMQNKYMTDRRIGLEFMDKDGAITAQYTLIAKDGHVTGYEKGINDVFITSTIAESLTNKLLSYEDEFMKHPIKATAKVMKLYAKAMKDGELKIN